jgi:hypothetical protein
MEDALSVALPRKLARTVQTMEALAARGETFAGNAAGACERLERHDSDIAERITRQARAADTKENDQ